MTGGRQNRLVPPTEIDTHDVVIDLSLDKPEEVGLFNIERCKTLLTLASTEKRPSKPATNVKVIEFPADHQRNNIRDVLEAFVSMEIPEHFEIRRIALGFNPFFNFSTKVNSTTQDKPLIIRIHYREYGSPSLRESGWSSG